MMFSALCISIAINCMQAGITMAALISRYVIGEGVYQVQLRNLELRKRLREANEDLEAMGNYIHAGRFEKKDSIVQEMKIK